MIQNDNLPYYRIYTKTGSRGHWHHEFINEFGYRSETVYPTDNYYLMLGCSHTFGMTLNFENLASHILETELGTPIINLGICGGSCNAMALNLQKLMMSDYPKPKVVIAQWPHIHRYMMFADPDNAFQFHPHMKARHIYEQFLNSQGLFETAAKNSFWYVNSLNIPVINYGISDKPGTRITANPANFFDIPQIDNIDFASDGKHPGPETNKKIVESISTELKKLT